MYLIRLCAYKVVSKQRTNITEKIQALSKCIMILKGQEVQLCAQCIKSWAGLWFGPSRLLP